MQRDDFIATIFWDLTGTIKLIVNINLNPAGLDIFHRNGVSVALSMGADCYRYLLFNAAQYAVGATWGAQLGVGWRNIFHTPNGVGTISVLIQSARPFVHDLEARTVLGELRTWVAQIARTVHVVQVANAALAGNALGNPEQENSIAEGPAFGDPSSSQFCKSPIQNSPLIFTGGKLDSLRKTVFRCKI